MANVTESPTWENGVYQIETTDPVLAGPNGIANVQAKQLANRTKYLKERADVVDAAKGSYPSLTERMAAVEASTAALGPDTQDAVMATLKFAIDQANVANKGVRGLHQFAQQEGIVTIKNRGVVTGCILSKSTTAARNLSIAAGICFAKGQQFAVADGNNYASVPSNTGTGAVTVYAYLYQDAYGFWRLAVTTIGQAVPDDGILIYNLTVPANSTDATDPNLSSVTLMDVRRIEAGFPIMLDNPAQASPQINGLPDSAYHITFDVLSAQGGPAEAKSLVVSSRANNGFTVMLAAAADNVVARYRVSRLNA
ncbi:MAG: hypothetical protein AUK53_11680 [Betaproteobacteria bacterium CG2_30_59_46]|nr:MAG: hypothetical protein AUK53_11680 [Betaproteobacteria bacterium CG2_30_59_46]